MASEGGFRVVIAGGGVAGIEALLALRELAGRRIEIELLAPQPEFVYRPLAVGEPFGLGEARHLRLDRVAAEHDANFRQDSLIAVDPGNREITTGSDETVGYDALLLAIGVRASEAVPGALTYGGGEANEAFRGLLLELQTAEAFRIIFAIPPEARWALPLYELALLTAHHVTEGELSGIELAIVTPETEPLDQFGPRASASVRGLLESADISLHTSTAPVALEGSDLLVASGAKLGADRVVALPSLDVPPIPGIPQGPKGFIDTDCYMCAAELPRVYAAGDATWFPVKQGGIAAQQADVAAASIARCVQPGIPRKPFLPVLRGALLTGTAPQFLRSEVGNRAESSTAGTAPLWWPPMKIAARLLSAYLTEPGDRGEPRPPFEDLEPDPEDPAESAQRHRDAVELALSAADADAGWDDYSTALRWLEVAEQLNITLPPDYVEKRARWSRALPG